MNRSRPRDLSARRVNQILSQVKSESSIAGRVETLSRYFVGRAYKPDPLIGSALKGEVFTASLAGFDCVTYIEAVVALARASNVDEFVEWLRTIRYEHGEVQWKRRNHYMTRWIRNNVREGIVKRISMPAVPTISKARVLNVVPGLDPQRTRMKYIPTAALPRLKLYLKTADLMCFVSTRPHLDVFHAGIIVRNGRKVLMRHASRSRGSVVEQNLTDFLKANQMAGVIVARPN